MIKAVIFHPRVIQVLSSEELKELKRFLSNHKLSVFFIAESDWRYKSAIKAVKGFLVDFVTKDKAKAKRGSPSYVQWISENYGINPHEILYVGQDSNLDWKTSINGGTFYIHAEFVKKPYIPVFKATSLSKLVGIIQVFREMEDGLFSYQFSLDDGVNRKFLFDIGVRIPVDGNRAVHLAEVIKSDYNQGHTIGGKPARESLLLLLLLQLWLTGTLGTVNYFVFYPGHKSGAGNRLLENYFSEIAKIAFKSYFKDGLIFRSRDTLQKHKARQQNNYGSITFKQEFNTLCIKKGVPVDRKIIVIDDFSTTGLSLEAAKSLLLSAGYKVEDIKLVAIGKYGYDYTTYTLKETINPYDCGDKIQEGDYYTRTYNVYDYRNFADENKLLNILKRWIRVTK